MYPPDYLSKHHKTFYEFYQKHTKDGKTDIPADAAFQMNAVGFQFIMENQAILQRQNWLLAHAITSEAYSTDILHGVVQGLVKVRTLKCKKFF